MEFILTRMMTSDPTQDLASDLAALVDAPRYRPGPPCYMQTILDGLEGEASEAMQVLVDNETISASALAKVLSKHGHHISPQSVSRHRRRGQHNGCRCER